jgi:hypothetical protein
MQKRPLPLKPAWYLYAYEAQKRLDAVKPSRSGRDEDRVMLQTLGIAQRDHAYPGTESDWHDLLARIRRMMK